jgi:hypothetical protein
LRPEWEKGYFRKGCTLEAMRDFSSALDVYKLGLKYSDGPELSSKVQRLDVLVKKQKRTQKAG